MYNFLLQVKPPTGSVAAIEVEGITERDEISRICVVFADGKQVGMTISNEQLWTDFNATSVQEVNDMQPLPKCSINHSRSNHIMSTTKLA